MKPVFFSVISAILIYSTCAPAAFAAESDWPHWRGPHHNGSAHEMPLPAPPALEQQVLWSAPMPGSSSATPIVGYGRVYVVSNDETETRGLALCLDQDSGKVLWTRELAHDIKQPRRNSATSCSPVVDEERVYFLFGTGELFALDHEGDTLWSKDLTQEYGPVAQQFGYSSSPLLLDNRLYIPVLHGQWHSGGSQDTFTDKDSYVLCLDASTGDVVWKKHRPSDANGESFDSYASAVPCLHGGHPAIVVQGGDYVTCHDALTGTELLRQEHNPPKGSNWRLIPSPVIADELIIAVQPRGGDIFAIRPGEDRDLAYEDSFWIREGRSTDVPTPLYYRNRLYVLNGTQKTLSCLDPATGKESWEGDIGGRATFWASPTAGDGKIYCFNEDGEVTVVSAGDEFKILSRGAFGAGPCKSSIAIAQGSLFIRTAEKLYRVGTAPAAK